MIKVNKTCIAELVIVEALGMANEKKESKSNEIGGLVFVGCLMIGFAIGFIMGNIAVGLFGFIDPS